MTVEKVKIADERVADLTCPATKLAAGEQIVCSATYTVTPADLEAGEVVNEATVAGDVPASGRTLDTTPSNEVVIRTAAAATPAVVQGANVGPVETGAPVPAPGGQLPRTGRNMATGLGTAVLLLVFGAALLGASRLLSGRVWRASPGR